MNFLVVVNSVQTYIKQNIKQKEKTWDFQIIK